MQCCNFIDLQVSHFDMTIRVFSNIGTNHKISLLTHVPFEVLLAPNGNRSIPTCMGV